MNIPAPYSLDVEARCDALLETAIDAMRERFRFTNAHSDVEAIKQLKACRRTEVVAALDTERLARARSA